MDSLSKIMLAVLFGLSACPFCSSSVQSASAHLLDELVEEFAQQVPVSGDVIVGVQSTSGSIPDADINLQILVTSQQTINDIVCVNITSKDGRYNARGLYALPSIDDTQWISLPYPTQYRAQLLDYDENSIAVLAHTGRCDELEPRPVFVAAWRSTNELGRQIAVFVNSKYSDRMWISAFARSSKDLVYHNKCLALDGGTRIAFDYACYLPRELIDNEILEITKIDRERRGNSWRPIFIDIR